MFTRRRHGYFSAAQSRVYVHMYSTHMYGVRVHLPYQSTAYAWSVGRSVGRSFRFKFRSASASASASTLLYSALYVCMYVCACLLACLLFITHIA